MMGILTGIIKMGFLSWKLKFDGVMGEKGGDFYRSEQKMTVQNIVVVCGGDL